MLDAWLRGQEGACAYAHVCRSFASAKAQGAGWAEAALHPRPRVRGRHSSDTPSLLPPVDPRRHCLVRPRPRTKPQFLNPWIVGSNSSIQEALLRGSGSPDSAGKLIAGENPSSASPRLGLRVSLCLCCPLVPAPRPLPVEGPGKDYGP